MDETTIVLSIDEDGLVKHLYKDVPAVVLVEFTKRIHVCPADLNVDNA